MNTTIDPRFSPRPECYESASNDRAYIEFQPGPGLRQGFAKGQLIHYTLEPEAGSAPDMPTERLTLAFYTADVVILGARLVHLTSLLCDNKLGVVRPVSGRPGTWLGGGDSYSPSPEVGRRGGLGARAKRTPVSGRLATAAKQGREA